MIRSIPRRWNLVALLSLVLTPLILLWPSLVGNNTYVPWDVAQFAPASIPLTAAEMAEVRHEQHADITEIHGTFIPELNFLHQEVSEGRLPHWNPYARSGLPAWASSLTGFLYPLNWPFLILSDPIEGLAMSAYLAYLIAGLLMYGFLLQLGLRPLPALLGAIAFSLSGTLTANASFYQRINALIWLPGILWAMLRISHTHGHRRIPGMLGLALCMFLTMTAGFPPYALVVTFLAMAFAMRLIIREGLQKGWGSGSNLALLIGCAATLGVGAAAVQILPMLEFFPESNRTMEPAANNLAYGGFDPYGYLGYLMPEVFGHPFTNQTGQLNYTFSPLTWLLQSRSSWQAENIGLPAGTVFEPNYNFCEYTVFVGITTFYLAIAGALSRGPRFRTFAVGAVFCLMLLASASIFISPILELSPFRWVPPQRYTGPLCMLMAALAAIGLEKLPSIGKRVRHGMWIGGLCLASLLALLGLWVYQHSAEEILRGMYPWLEEKYSSRHPGLTYELVKNFLGPNMPLARERMVAGLLGAASALLLGALLFLLLPILTASKSRLVFLRIVLIGLVMTELLSFGMPLNRGRDLKHSLDTPVHQFLREQRDQHLGSGGFSVQRAYHKTTDRPGPFAPFQLPPGQLLKDRVRDLHSYTFVDKRTHQIYEHLYGKEQLIKGVWPNAFADDELLQRPLWDMLGTRFILSNEALNEEFVGPRVGPHFKGPLGEFFIYERESALGRAWVVPDFKAVSEDEILAGITGEDFAPQAYAVVDLTTAKALESEMATAKVQRGNYPRSIRKLKFPGPFRPNQVLIEVEPGEPGFLILNDTFMPGWTATINNDPVTIHRANHFQRLLVLKEGGLRVQLHYTTPGFRAGLSISMASLIILALLALSFATSRSKPRKSEVSL